MNQAYSAISSRGPSWKASLAINTARLIYHVSFHLRAERWHWRRLDLPCQSESWNEEMGLIVHHERVVHRVHIQRNMSMPGHSIVHGLCLYSVLFYVCSKVGIMQIIWWKQAIKTPSIIISSPSLAQPYQKGISVELGRGRRCKRWNDAGLATDRKALLRSQRMHLYRNIPLFEGANTLSMAEIFVRDRQ